MLQFIWLHKKTIVWVLLVSTLAFYVLFLKACQPDVNDMLSAKDKLYQEQIDTLVDSHQDDLSAREAEINRLLVDLSMISKKYQTARDELKKTRTDRVENDATKDPKELTSRLAKEYGLTNLDQ